MKTHFVVAVLSVLIHLVAADCPLPNSTVVVSPLAGLLQDSGGDGSQTYSPTIIGSIQYVCLAQGNMIDTYRTVSVIATYTPNPGVSSRTSIFQLICSNDVWTADTSGLLADPHSSVINATTRTDCTQCRHSNGHDRCRCKLIHKKSLLLLLSHVACNNACNTGLMRCTGAFSDECCLTFTSSGQCSTTLSCSSSGANFIANADNGYFCSKLHSIITTHASNCKGQPRIECLSNE